MNRIDQLATLQDIDIRISENLRSRRAAEARLTDDGSLVAAQQALDLSTQSANEIRARLASLDLETRSITAKIGAVEARLYDGRTINPKELTGLEQDDEMLKRQKSEVEDRTLDAMVELENLEATRAADLARFERINAESSGAATHAHAELESLRQEASKLKAVREQLAAHIPAADLAIYERLRQEKKGRALAHVKGTACEACSVTLPSGLASRVRVGEELSFCTNCGRILIS